MTNQGHYVVDIRVFIATLTLAMAISFLAGLGLGEPAVSHSVPVSEQQAYKVRDKYTISYNEASKKVSPPHLPAGQHLLVDIEGVEAAFLNSEERLAKAMVATAEAAGLVMLSYHCHSLHPMGVSCVGVLLESHISFHTWPDEGVITLDVFTGGDSPLLPVVPTIQQLFGPPRNDGSKVRSQWSHELRGFRDAQEKQHYLDDSSDLSLWVLSPLEVYSKTQIYSNYTQYQRIDIWDLVELTDTPSYEDVIQNNLTAGDPRLLTPELVTPDRLLFLDGTLQSIASAEQTYHEVLVHPGMLAHPNPKRVAIIGGGEGATLREVLKHKTVSHVTMIELDEEMVKVAQEYLPKMSNCSDLVGSAANCFNDERVEVHYRDGREWFIERYGDNPKVHPAAELFDVIILDALDPEEDVKIAEELYGDQAFVAAMMKSLSKDGILTVQVGTAATIDDARPDKSIYEKREKLFQLLENNSDVASMLVYEDPHCGFLEPHSFLVSCKDVSCKSRWYARSDVIDYQIYERIVLTHSKQRALKYYDGTTQRSYQWPGKGWETVYCRREPMPFECAYRNLDVNAEMFEFDLENENENSFTHKVDKNDDDEVIGSHVYAKVDIPKGSYIMSQHLARSLQVTTRNLEGLKNNAKVGGGRVAIIEDLLGFVGDYEHLSSMPGLDQHFVEVGGSILIQRVDDPNQANVGRWLPPHPSGIRPKYSPVYERHRMSFDVFIVATRDIKEGEEILVPKDLWRVEGIATATK